MSVIFIDTNCELNYKTAKELGFHNVIRMPYTICDEQHYYDLGENYNANEFFSLVRAGNMPITSGLNSEEYKEYFEPFFKKSEDILYISFSTELSGTFQYMDVAVKELSAAYPKAKFTRFDTKGISLGAGLSVYAAGKLLQAGKSNAEIIEFLSTFIYRVNAVFTPDDLMYLKKGGRLSSTAAALGTLLQVKPIIRLNNDGKLENTGKVNGRKKALVTLANEAIEHAEDLDTYPIIILNGDCADDCAFLRGKLEAALPNAEIIIYDIGPVIGTHCGPGTVGLCFVGHKRDR